MSRATVFLHFVVMDRYMIDRRNDTLFAARPWKIPSSPQDCPGNGFALGIGDDPVAVEERSPGAYISLQTCLDDAVIATCEGRRAKTCDVTVRPIMHNVHPETHLAATS